MTGAGLADPAMGDAAELRHIRLMIHDAIERTELAPISLKLEVNQAFSAIRTAVNAAVPSEHLRSRCLETIESCEGRCRQHLKTLHAQHLSFLYEMVGHDNQPAELQTAWAKRKSAEFEEMTSIPELKFMTEYPKVPDGTVVPDFKRNSPSSPAWQKEKFYASSVSGKKHDLNFPKPWEKHLTGSESKSVQRSNSAQPQQGDRNASSRRPASSLGFTRSGPSADASLLLTRPRTPSAAAMAGTKMVQVPHAIPNLRPWKMPSGVEQWPARTTTLQSTDVFQGEGGETGDAAPARGYLNANARFNVCLQTNKPTLLEPQVQSNRRPVTAKPAEVDQIERFIDVEFKKTKCQMDEYNSKRLTVFRLAFESVCQTFTSWGPLLKTIMREYDAYVNYLEVQSERLVTFKERATDLEKDFNQKYEFMREETARVVQRVQAEAKKTVDEAEESLRLQLERKVEVEEALARRTTEAEALQKRVSEADFQLRVLLKAYNANLKDCNNIMEASKTTSVRELVDLFKTMVHIQAMWDLEQRMQDDKEKVIEDRDLWVKNFHSMKEDFTAAHRAKYIILQICHDVGTDRYIANLGECCRGDFEGRYMHMVRQSDELCKFFIAKFPEAKQIKFSDGKLYLADAGRKPKEASVKIALMNLRVHMDEMQHKHEELECKYEQTRVKLIEIQKGSESTEQWEEKDYFKGLGETADVQEALHFTEGANIKNKNLTLGQVEKAVKSMLAKRKKEEEVALAKGLTAERPDIWTDLHKYALSNNKSSVARAEWAYSFCDSLKRFSRDNLLCRVFNQMLQGRACPAVYYEMISIPDLIYERALIKDKEQRTNGRMPRKMFQSLVENFFKPIVNGGSGHAKDKIIMEELFRRLKNDEMAGTWGVKPKEIEIKKLFMETKEGERSYFVLGLMEQFLDDRGLYLMDLVLYIQRRRNPNAQETTPKELMDAMKRIDPRKDPEQMGTIAKQIFGIRKSLPIQEFEQRLLAAGTFRSTERTLPSVKQALKPKSLELIVGQRKLVRICLMLRVVKCFRAAGQDFRRKK